MAAPAHIARENGKKGGRPKGSKGFKTIAIEKARKFYLQQVAKHLPPIVQAHIEAAYDPDSKEERIYALNQMIGKPKETVEMTTEVRLKIDV